RRGGMASPALGNRTLDGLERLLAMRFAATPAQRKRHKVHLVRYADDFIITGTSKELLRDEVQPLVAHFLKERGLELSHEKTSITHVADGFDFLGQNVRRFRSEEHTSELQSLTNLVCRLLLEKKKSIDFTLIYR